ncbi:DUF3817 domain-containing protein [Nakamurella sp. YIM 132087]|uniref:DUF3817 domain-containing protein n=1 Tax=Nakamurella alba TaxID=2665158 RepID=A0A7K1FEV6_9ACTN|nr:DUF3817 domain-containing protein [Nakamurella alba]MTD12637.1 DUF3817 domain-containing protein [Nakamurella alba]
MGPLMLFRRVAVAEAITWVLLLIGMFLKYVTRTTDLGVSIFGMVHGIVFVAYCVVTVLVWVDQRWPAGRGLLALFCAIPPLLTLWFDRRAERRGHLARTWRLREDGTAVRAPERVVRWLLVRPLRGALVGVLTVAALTGVALVVGPPASS